MNELYEKLNKDHDLILLMKFGSHLYGTNTENSDVDYKGIFMPTKEMIYLNKIPKSINYDTSKTNAKNTKDDVDCELYSLHYFIKLALKGETAAIDILHVNKENLICSNEVFENIVKNKNKLLTKNLKSFVGYARKQASKYGLRGSRLSDAEKVILTLKYYDPNNKLSTIRKNLPFGDHIYLISRDDEEFYQVCGKKLQFTSKIGYCLDILNKFIDQYGHRARLAKENKGVDFKAMSHALRSSYQTKELLLTGNIEYPLKQAKFLKSVKNGELDFTSEVLPELERSMDEVEKLSIESNYPNKPDYEFFERFLVNTCENYLK